MLFNGSDNKAIALTLDVDILHGFAKVQLFGNAYREGIAALEYSGQHGCVLLYIYRLYVTSTKVNASRRPGSRGRGQPRVGWVERSETHLKTRPACKKAASAAVFWFGQGLST